MDGCVEGTLEKSPLTSAFPSFQRSTIDADCFLPPLPLPLVSRASSKPVLCFKEIPSSPLLAQGSLHQMTSSCKRSHLRFFLPRRDTDNFPCVLRFSLRLGDCIFYESSSTNQRFTLFSSTPPRRSQVRVERNRLGWNIPFYWEIDTMVKSLCVRYRIQDKIVTLEMNNVNAIT